MAKRSAMDPPLRTRMPVTRRVDGDRNSNVKCYESAGTMKLTKAYPERQNEGENPGCGHP